MPLDAFLYRRVVDACRDRGVEPVVTLQHFTVPAWQHREGGWYAPDVVDRFRRYSHDQLFLVMPAEDDRWHVPGEPPAGPECLLCAKQDLGLLLEMVLPVPAGRAA